MFEQLRRSLNELLERGIKPEDRRTALARMKTTLVQAQLGVDDLRDALARSRRQLDAERRELETVQRRKSLATGINDAQTVTVAARFERQHQDRIRLLEEKIAVQAREVELGERELEEMKAELRRAMAGIPDGAPGSGDTAAELDEMLGSAGGSAREEIDALARERARADRDADAARRLEELKKKMGR